MKKFLLLFLLAPLLIQAQQHIQMTSDHRLLIERCIDLPDLRPYMEADNIGNNKPLVIMLNENVTEQFSLMKFGETVRFETMETIYTENLTPFIKFTTLDMDATSALVRFTYSARVKGEVVFERDVGGWTITRQKLTPQ